MKSTEREEERGEGGREGRGRKRGERGRKIKLF